MTIHSIQAAILPLVCLLFMGCHWIFLYEDRRTHSWDSSFVVDQDQTIEASPPPDAHLFPEAKVDRGVLSYTCESNTSCAGTVACETPVCDLLKPSASTDWFINLPEFEKYLDPCGISFRVVGGPDSGSIHWIKQSEAGVGVLQGIMQSNYLAEAFVAIDFDQNFSLRILANLAGGNFYETSSTWRMCAFFWNSISDELTIENLYREANKESVSKNEKNSISELPGGTHLIVVYSRIVIGSPEQQECGIRIFKEGSEVFFNSSLAPFQNLEFQLTSVNKSTFNFGVGCNANETVNAELRFFRFCDPLTCM